MITPNHLPLQTSVHRQRLMKRWACTKLGEGVGVTTIDEVARSQQGLIRRDQLVAVGTPARTIDVWVGSGRLVRVAPRVFRLAGSPVTWEQHLMATVLCAGPGAIASHRAAAVLWALLPSGPIEVSVPASRGPRLAGAVVHRSKDLAKTEPSTRLGIPLTNPLRTIADLGAVLNRFEVSDVMERALQMRLVSLKGLQSEWARLGRPGRNGSGVLRRLLEQRALGDAPASTILEARMAGVLVRYDLPNAVFQYEIRDSRGRFVARVDFAYPRHKIAIEVDGFGTHSTPDALQADLQRQNALVNEGWTVLRFTWQDVTRRPSHVAETIRRCLCTASAA